MVYLLCFDKKFKHARHYIGFAESEFTFENRLRHHKKGRGSRLMDAVTKAGIDFKVSRTWANGDRNFERKLKNRKNAAKLCPLCVERARREKVLEKESVFIKELNAPPIMACPVIEASKVYPVVMQEKPNPNGTFIARMNGEIFTGDIYAKPQGNPIPSRWERVWSRVAGFLKLQTVYNLFKQ